MLRTLLALSLLVGMSEAHGGAYRPPPRGRPGDPFTPTGGRAGPMTATSRGGNKLPPWEAWWAWNREHYIQTRQRMEKRNVVTGRRLGKAAPLFNRKAFRENVLLPEMLKALHDSDEEVRTAAAVALGKFRVRVGVESLKVLYAKDPVKQVREAALLGLLVARDPELKEFFHEQIEDRKVERRIRGLSVLALGFLKDSEYLRGFLDKKQAKIKGSKADVREIRACATLALGFTSSTDVAIPLVQAAMDKYEEEEVRGYAPCSLGRLKAEMALPELLRLVKQTDQERSARYGAAIAMGWLVKRDNEAVIDMMGRKATRDKDPGVRTLLAIALGRIGGDRAASYLVGGLNGMDQRERGFYYLGMGISRSEDAGDIMLRQFPKLKSNLDRAVCALALGLANHRKAAPLLLEELEKGNPVFVPHGMVALGLMNEKKAIPLVREQLEEKDPVVIREGALALALLQGHAAMPKLIELLKESKTTLVRGSIAFSLGYVGTDKALDPLLEIYRDKSRPGELRAIALAALGRIGDPERIPLLSQLAYALNPFVGTDAVAEALTIL